MRTGGSFWKDYGATLAVATLPLLGFWLYGLFDLDEGFYAAITAEMNRRGEWVIPYYNGSPWFEKPILLYWLAKPSIAIFGEMVGPRLPSVLATLGTYLVVAWFCSRRMSVAAGRASILVMSGSLLFVAAGRMMLTDPVLVLLLTSAFLTFWESLVGDRRWRLATAALLGLSVLAKGPVGLLLFAILAIWTAWRQPPLRPAFRGWWLLGTLILAAAVATWYLPAYLTAGQEFVQRFLIDQNLRRFTGGDVAHAWPGPEQWLLYFAILLVGMAPYSGWVVKAWPRDGDPLRRYLAAWAVVVVVFFTIGGSKLPHYILPAVPPLAMLFGAHLAQKPRPWMPYWTLAMAVIVNVAFISWYEGRIPGAPSHGELHRMTRRARETGEPVAVYQMSRRDKDRGTGKLKIQETSHPSVIFLLDRVIVDAESLSETMELRKPFLLLTRVGRIDEGEEAELAKAGLEASPVETGRFYALYRVEPR